MSSPARPKNEKQPRDDKSDSEISFEEKTKNNKQPHDNISNSEMSSPARPKNEKQPRDDKSYSKVSFQEKTKNDKRPYDNKSNSEMSFQEKPNNSYISIKERFWVFLTIGIFIIQYGICFGVELSVNSVMNLYFLYNFKIAGCNESDVHLNSTTTIPLLETTQIGNVSVWNSSVAATIEATTTAISVSTRTADVNKCSILDQNTASLIASLFGLMNLFARATGGVISDVICKYRGIPGRLLVHFLCLAFEGILLIIFSKMESIASAIVVMITFSLCVQMSEGTTYAIVPYILPTHVGVVAGLVGAGGNGGALIWTTLWSLLVEVHPSQWFFYLGIIVLSGSALSALSVVQHCRIWNVFSKNHAYTVS